MCGDLRWSWSRHPDEPEVWEFLPNIEIGKRYASQSRYTIIGDSMKSDFAVLSGHLHINLKGIGEITQEKPRTHMVLKPVIIPGEPIKPEVPPPIERLKAREVSNLEKLAEEFTDLCARALLVEQKP